MDKSSTSGREICTKFITPALRQAGWGQRPFLVAGGLTASGESFETG
jgi:type I site-specific restriction endonuclease